MYAVSASWPWRSMTPWISSSHGERLVPGDLAPLVAVAHHRHAQAVGVVVEMTERRALRADVALRHPPKRPSLDLADPLAGEVEVLPHLFERPGLAAVEAEPQREDLTLALVERREQLLDLVGQQRGGGHLEGRLGRAVLDDVAELGVAVFTQRLRQRQRLGGGLAGLRSTCPRASPSPRPRAPTAWPDDRA